MADMNTILSNIETLREKLLSLLRTKNELLDPEVLKASTLLDNAINDYNMQIILGHKDSYNT